MYKIKQQKNTHTHKSEKNNNNKNKKILLENIRRVQQFVTEVQYL